MCALKRTPSKYSSYERFVVYVIRLHGRRCGKCRRKIHEYSVRRIVCGLVALRTWLASVRAHEGYILTRGRLTDHLPGSRARVTERRKVVDGRKSRCFSHSTYPCASYSRFSTARHFPLPSTLFFESRGSILVEACRGD